MELAETKNIRMANTATVHACTREGEEDGKNI